MVFSSTKAVTVLGMPQTPLKTSLADAIAWFRDQGLLPNHASN
jgi:dihydroflavonol-4-reductase